MAAAKPNNEQKAPDTDQLKADFERWHKRLDASREVRKKWERTVWKPLYEGVKGALLCGRGDADLVNGFAQHVDVVFPHMAGDNRECSVRVRRVGPGEDAAEKFAFADDVGDQADGLMQNTGMYGDQHGRPGELIKAMFDAMYALGVIVFGFEIKRGRQRVKAGEPDGEQRIVDLDWAVAEHHERQDAGMPWGRRYSPMRVLFDFTFNDAAAGRWFAVESYMGLAECKARWPDFADDWQRTHKSVPSWDGEEGGAGDRGDEEGVVKLFHVYTRDPSRVLIVPARGAGVTQVVESQELDLGIEGLPLLLLGARWLPEEPYPKPALADGYAAALAENDSFQTIRAAASKIKSMILTNDQKLAAQLREGDDAGVYVLGEGKPLEGAVRTEEVGALRDEHLKLAELMRQNWERNTGHADFQLGRREPGNPTIPQIQARQAHISTRLSGIIKPVRIFEAMACQRLIAVAYSKLDLLNGVQLPLGRGPNVRFAVFDANRPMIGELLDYEFEVQCSDVLMDADVAQKGLELMEALGHLEQMVDPATGQPALLAHGKQVNWPMLAETIARSSNMPRAGELIIEAPPPPEPQAQPAAPGGPPVEESGQGGGAAMQPAGPQSPPPVASPANLPPEAMLEQLYGQLSQVPEGDPNEGAILQQIAQVQAVIEQSAVPAGAGV